MTTPHNLISKALREDGYTPEDIIESYDDVNEYGTRETHYLVYIEELEPIGEAHATAIIKTDEDGDTTVDIDYN